jgi:MoaA/NifB/PqqE/SkfB family radical SAM enzyme
MNSGSYPVSFLNEYPRISEIEDMVDFCARHETIYIYGASENCEYLAKFLKISGIVVAGYVVSTLEKRNFHICALPILSVDDIPDYGNAGILLGLSEKYYEFVISILKDKEIGYFRMSEHNKREIAGCLRPQPVGKLMLEMNLVDHCNLKCRNCDHYSNIAPKKFLSIEEFTRDIELLAQICAGSLEAIKLVGGEPLLNPDIVKFLKVTRKHFPHSRIPLITNGLLLLRMGDEFWRALADYNVLLHVTEYPSGVNYEAIHAKVLEYGVLNNNLNNNGLFDDDSPKYMVKFPFDIKGNQKRFYFIGCHHRICSCVLRHGRIYPCPPLAYIEYFNRHFGQNLLVSDADYIDLYQVSHYQEIADFLSGRIPFCRYCDIKHRFHHGNRFEWEQSSGQLEEYIWAENE